MKHVPTRLVLLSALLASCPAGGEEPPSVILITLDTTRPDFLGCYGSENPTPHLDRLAAGGVRFERNYATSAVTPVSHASILTGLTPYQHGLRVLAAPGGYRLPEDVPTLATVFHERGYRTLAVHSSFPVSSTFGFARGFDVFESLELEMTERPGGRKGWNAEAGERRSDLTMDLVLEELERTARPYFLWVHLWDPHDPRLVPPAEWIPDSVPRVETRDGQVGFPPGSAIYAAEVRFVDRQLGRLFDHLRERGTFERTLIAVTADHGEGLEDGLERHGWEFHRILYDEQIHVPLLLSGPGIPAGGVVGELNSSVDLFPTLLDYADLAGPAGIEGRSLRGLIEGRSEAPRSAYADQINGFDLNATMVDRRPEADFLYAVVSGDWKLIWRPTRPERSELYHLAEDPLETLNRLSTEPERTRELLADLARRDGWVLRMFSGDAPSPEVLAMLESIGYSNSGDAQGADPNWQWLCPRERTRHEERGHCPDCDTGLVLVKRR
ncbi:MAG: sulfatase [Planctomycetota bacterium]|nr:sulfatase [Planctomycetota bacterium]